MALSPDSVGALVVQHDRSAGAQTWSLCTISSCGSPALPALPTRREGGSRCWDEDVAGVLRAPPWFCAGRSLLWPAHWKISRVLGVLLTLGFGAVWHEVRAGQERCRAEAGRALGAAIMCIKGFRDELKYFIQSSVLPSNQMSIDSC